MKLIFIVNVDWFFVSHFLHLARRARLEGWDVAVATQTGAKRQQLIDEGLKVIDLPVRRGGLVPSGMFQAVKILSAELRRSPGAIIHGFGIFGIVIGTIASLKSGSTKRIFSITGRGYSAVSPSTSAKIVRLVSSRFCSWIADGRSTRWIAENASDLQSCDLQKAVEEGRTAVVGGAGVNINLYHVTPLPKQPPLKCALVARMIWSKGADLAVEAVKFAREQGFDIELSLVGPLDHENPAGLSEQQLEEFDAIPGIHWLGHITDINDFWATQHLAVLPSRGGEGIPKALIEAGACGRPILTTDVPGCRELAIATNGWFVASEDAHALAEMLIRIAGDAALDARGQDARKAVAEGYTQDKVWSKIEKLYRELEDPRSN